MLRSRAAWFLLVLGLLTMVGDWTGFDELKGLGAATAASPAPKVFSAVDGYETYSTTFVLEWSDPQGEEHSLILDSERYAGLRGPYNRRNVFGAMLAYGPVLIHDERAAPMFWQVSRFALSGDAPLLRELGLDPARVGRFLRVRFLPRPGVDSEIAIEFDREAP